MARSRPGSHVGDSTPIRAGDGNASLPDRLVQDAPPEDQPAARTYLEFAAERPGMFDLIFRHVVHSHVHSH